MSAVTFHSYQSQYSYHQQASSRTDLLKDDDEKLKQVSQSGAQDNVSSRVTVSLSTERSTSFATKTHGVDTYAAIGSASKSNPYANTILAAIENQLVRDQSSGADSENLQTRLDAGLEGFLSGFDQAAKELEERGLLTEEVARDINDTKAKVLGGLQDIAERYGLTANIPEDALPGGSSSQPDSANRLSETLSSPVDRSGASATYGVAQSREFSFDLKTADGDRVTISAESLRVGVSRLSYGSGGASLGLAGRQEDAFSFSVKGELDEGELKAINDLLNQVNDVADTFFNGDVEDAFAMALEVGFDESEISQFALNIRRTDIERVNSAYGLPSGNSNAPGFGGNHQGSLMNNKMAALGDFAKQLNNASLTAQLLGQDSHFVTELAENISRIHYQDDKKTASLTSVIGALQQS